MATNQDLTLVRNAFHRPDEPRHFMTATRSASQASATLGGVPLAASDKAVIVCEVGYAIYEPVVYFPRDDVTMAALTRTEKSTFCPLKGTTEYFDYVDGDTRVADVAWSYVDAIDGFPVVGFVAFDASKVDVTR